MPILSVDPQTVKQWIDANEAILVDVRESAEYAAQHIPGAHHVPLGTIAAEQFPQRNGRKLVLQCQSGARSMSASTALQKRMPDETIYNLSGGILAWEKAGLPIVGSGSKMIPLNRQVQMTIGVILLVLNALGWFINPLFLVGTAVLGLGLIFAGLTGICGLARLMAKAPWNQIR